AAGTHGRSVGLLTTRSGALRAAGAARAESPARDDRADRTAATPSRCLVCSQPRLAPEWPPQPLPGPGRTGTASRPATTALDHGRPGRRKAHHRSTRAMLRPRGARAEHVLWSPRPPSPVTGRRRSVTGAP